MFVFQEIFSILLHALSPLCSRNGYMQSLTTTDSSGSRQISGANPYWLFVENESDLSRTGYYKKYYKAKTGGGVKQAIAWASIYKESSIWVGLTDTVSGHTTHARSMDNAFSLLPHNLLIGRWNYLRPARGSSIVTLRDLLARIRTQQRNPPRTAGSFVRILDSYSSSQ